MVAEIPAQHSAPDRLGTHVLADIVDVADPGCFSAGFIADAFAESLRAAGATVLRFVVQEFTPQGLSAIAVLAESHASLHTWPERRTVLVDVFACGALSPNRVVDELVARLGRCSVRVRTLERHAGSPATAVDAGTG